MHTNAPAASTLRMEDERPLSLIFCSEVQPTNNRPRDESDTLFRCKGLRGPAKGYDKPKPEALKATPPQV